MKKYLTTILALSLLVVSLTACNNKTIDVETEELSTMGDVLEKEREEEEIVEETYEEITDFTFSLDEVNIEDATKLDTTIDIGGSSAYHILTNHTDDIYEINIYKISSLNNSDVDFELKNREYFATYQNYFPMEDAYILYDVKNKPDYIFSFLMRNNQVFEYYIEKEDNQLKVVQIDESLSNNLVNYLD